MRKTPENIVKVTLINLETGDEINLEERPESCCYIIPQNERVKFGDKEIQFRIDWGDVSVDGDPTLDADFIDSKTKRHLAAKSVEGHHTLREFDPSFNKYIYHFKHEKLEIIFITRITKKLSMTCTARIVRRYRGIIVGESLNDESEVKSWNVLSAKSGHWNLYKVQVDDDGQSLMRFFKDLQSKMKDGPWYNHFYYADGSELFVIYKDRVIKTDKNKENWTEALKRGGEIGIPLEQLDFTPNIFEDEIF